MPMNTPPTFNLADLLEIVAATVPEREALVCNEQRRTYADLNARANSLARWLRQRGLGAGDTVGIHAYNRIEYMEACFAAFKIGAIPVNVNYRYTADECRYVYANAELKALIYEQALEEIVAAARSALPDLKILLCCGGGPPGLADASDFEAAATFDPRPLDDLARSDDDLLLLYTGGTTGMPKGVMWTHKAVFFGGFGGGGNFSPRGPIAQPAELAERVRENFRLNHLPCGPLMHGAGMWGTMIGLLAGHTVCLNGKPDFDARYILDLVDREAVSCLSIVGDAMGMPLLDALQAEPGRWKLANLFAFSSAGALFSDHLRDALKRFLPANVVITNGMGSSEAGHVGSGALPAADGLIRLAPNPANGVAVDGVRFARPGETGILVKSGYLPLGYFKDPQKTAETFVIIEGRHCVLVGDIARLEEDGSITLFGRNSQCINTGGEKVFTEEVEEAVRSFPAVYDALVVGITDPRWGQKVVAVVALRPGTAADGEAIRRHCRQLLAGYKVPKEFVFVDAVARNVVGKADYRRARQVAEQALAG